MTPRKDHAQIIKQIDSSKESNCYYRNNSEYFDQLLRLVDDWPGSYVRKLRAVGRKRELKKNAPYEHLLIWVNEITASALNDPFYTLATKVAWVLRGLTAFPVCPVCGKDDKFRQRNTNVFSIYGGAHCSISCGARDEETHKKIKQTKRIKYGDENFTNSAKAEATRQQHIAENPDFWHVRDEKSRAAWQKKYGVDHPMKSDAFKERLVESCLNRRGVKLPIQDPDVKETVKKRNNEKYGVDWITQSDEFKAKCIDFYQRNFGVNGPSQVKSIQTRQHAKYQYDGKMFDSAPELAYYIWLKDNDISFCYHPDKSFEYEYAGKKHKYFPDFEVNGQYFELKGDQFLKEDGTWRNPFDCTQDALYEAKHQCILKNNVVIMHYDQYVKFVDYVKDTRGSSFMKSCRLDKDIY